jgi:hypothetical protein
MRPSFILFTHRLPLKRSPTGQLPLGRSERRFGARFAGAAYPAIPFRLVRGILTPLVEREHSCAASTFAGDERERHFELRSAMPWAWSQSMWGFQRKLGPWAFPFLYTRSDRAHGVCEQSAKSPILLLLNIAALFVAGYLSSYLRLSSLLCFHFLALLYSSFA